MKPFILLALLLPILVCPARRASAQRVQLGEVLVVQTPVLAPSTDAGTFEAHVLDRALPAWDAVDAAGEAHFFRADRGKDTGSYWIVWSYPTVEARQRSLPAGDASGFSDAVRRAAGADARLPASLVIDQGGYTDYALVADGSSIALPEVEVLGVHYIQVRPDRSDAFDAFVRERLHPALVGTIPGMDLLYYKGVRGTSAGQYLLIFAIATPADRAHYWPTDSSETDALGAAFAPLNDLARELASYQVEGTYLEAESGAAAAIFESLEWTDFAILR